MLVRRDCYLFFFSLLCVRTSGSRFSLFRHSRSLPTSSTSTLPYFSVMCFSYLDEILMKIRQDLFDLTLYYQLSISRIFTNKNNPVFTQSYNNLTKFEGTRFSFKNHISDEPYQLPYSNPIDPCNCNTPTNSPGSRSRSTVAFSLVQLEPARAVHTCIESLA